MKILRGIAVTTGLLAAGIATVAVVAAGRVEPVSDPNDLRQRMQEALGAAPMPTPEVAPA